MRQMTDRREYLIVFARLEPHDFCTAREPRRAHQAYRACGSFALRHEYQLATTIKFRKRCRRTAHLGASHRMRWHEIREMHSHVFACARNHILLGTAGVGDNGRRGEMW